MAIGEIGVRHPGKARFGEKPKAVRFARRSHVSDPTLRGSVKERCATALLLIDVINDLDFPESNQLLRLAVPMARRLAALKHRAHLAKSHSR